MWKNLIHAKLIIIKHFWYFQRLERHMRHSLLVHMIHSHTQFLILCLVSWMWNAWCNFHTVIIISMSLMFTFSAKRRTSNVSFFHAHVNANVNEIACLRHKKRTQNISCIISLSLFWQHQKVHEHYIEIIITIIIIGRRSGWCSCVFKLRFLFSSFFLLFVCVV